MNRRRSSADSETTVLSDSTCDGSDVISESENSESHSESSGDDLETTPSFHDETTSETSETEDIITGCTETTHTKPNNIRSHLDVSSTQDAIYNSESREKVSKYCDVNGREEYFLLTRKRWLRIRNDYHKVKTKVGQVLFSFLFCNRPRKFWKRSSSLIC